MEPKIFPVIFTKEAFQLCNNPQYRSFSSVLRRELIPALGCTEPIAIAFAAAKAREVLGAVPDHMEMLCSGNIIKNVKGVTVPNSGGICGVEIAAVLGVVGGNATRELEVLEDITPEHLTQAQRLIKDGFFRYSLAEEVENLYIAATVFAGNESAKVTIINRHTLITEIEKNGKIIYKHNPVDRTINTDWSMWSIKEILDFADNADISPVANILRRQIDLNTAIASEGMNHLYGAQVGRTLLSCGDEDVRTRAKAYAAAGSDARMGGCSLPVVINSGSGNQGITVSLPVMAYAEKLDVPEEKLLRAMALSNLVAIYQKHYIGSLSAFCGAVTAACGSGAAITYLCGGDYDAICRTIINTIANVGGIICDGAKASCAAKIASSVDAAITAHTMSMRGLCFHNGEGIVKSDIEETIRSMGYVGRVGMKETDVQILHLMMNQIEL